MLSKALLSASVSAAPVYIEDTFSTFLYTGNNSTQTITNGIDLSGEGGLVWFKGRTAVTSHFLQDSAVGWNKVRKSNTTDSDTTISYVDPLSNGFTWYGGSWGDSGIGLVFWTFRKAPKFFDVVTYTGTGAVQNITHNLGSVPGCIIVKKTNDSSSWITYHRGLNGGTNPSQYFVALNLTNAEAASSNPWNNTAPTSAVFTAGLTNSEIGITYVAYLFAHDAGGFGTAGTDNVVSCGTFTTDGSGNVGTVNLGWEPQWIFTKKTNGTQNWYQWDNMRGWALTSSSTLSSNLSDAEVAMGGTSYLYPTATGFGGSSNFFGPNATTIYIAIRRGPMKTPTDATKVLNATATTASSGNNDVNVGFPPDHIILRSRLASREWLFSSRLTGGSKYLDSSSTAAEGGGGFFYFDNKTGFSGQGMTSESRIQYSFRRAPGFFDVVAWTASASTSITHGLGVTPELIIAKSRSVAGESWTVYTQPGGRGNVLFLNTINGNVGIADYWGTSGPTATTFGVAASGSSNNVGNMIAYLFATRPGVSKVGSYTGTGTTKQIDCGFTAGARFVLIKRTDSTGDWYVWDTARGIISGNDPYLLLNSAAAEVTGTDYIDPLSSGFEISSTAPAAINANGGTYIFLAIA